MNSIKRLNWLPRYIKITIYLIILVLLINDFGFSSGGYDNGTSNGKGVLQLDFTLNPFNIFEQGQSYIVCGYGLSNKFDLHGYLSKHAEGYYSYYYGIYLQLIKLKFIDLSSAVGLREYSNSDVKHIFYPQLLFTLKLKNNYEIGGSLVSIRNFNNNYLGSSFDIFISIPIKIGFIKKINKNIYRSNLSVGLFKPALWKPKNSLFHPTYSIDTKTRLFD